jgi:hypothetical protein
LPTLTACNIIGQTMYILASGYIHLYFSKFLGILRTNLTLEATGKILLNKNVAMVLLRTSKQITNVNTQRSSRLVIGSGCSIGDHMTATFITPVVIGRKYLSFNPVVGTLYDLWLVPSISCCPFLSSLTVGGERMTYGVSRQSPAAQSNYSDEFCYSAAQA